MEKREKFAKRVFMIAGIYGLAVLLPQYFLEDMANRQSNHPIMHPEYFYGFIGVAVAWQAAFLVIARDVIRFHLFMLPAILEKVAFGGAAVVLCFLGRADVNVLAAGLLDLLIGMFFVAAFVGLRGAASIR